MIERRRFTTTPYNSSLGGYSVFDRDARVATFVEQGMAVRFCKLLRLFPGMINSCRNLTLEELEHVGNSDIPMNVLEFCEQIEDEEEDPEAEPGWHRARKFTAKQIRKFVGSQL